MTRVKDSSCTAPTRMPEEYMAPEYTVEESHAKNDPLRTPDEKEQRLSQEKKSDIQRTGNMRQSELLASTKTADSTQSSKSEASQKVNQAIAEKRANGGSHRDVIVAGAKADTDHVKLNGDQVDGEPRLREIFTNTGNRLKDKHQKYENGKPILPVGDGKEKATSWCGIWATDIWKRSGIDCKWVVGQGISGPDGKRLPTVATTGNKDPELKKVKPGDVIIINDYKDNKIKAGSTNHHAIVTETVYQVDGQKDKITCPPSTVPENGRLVGFKTMNGNYPGASAEGDRMSAIREGYVDLTTEEQQSDGSTRKISGYYPAPVKKESEPAKTQ